MKKYLIPLFLSFPFFCFSQRIENVDFTVKDNIMIVTYDLVDCPKKEKYDIKLRVISDNGSDDGIIPSHGITGDLKEISCGKNKKIKWDVLKNETELIGKVQIMVVISNTFYKKNNYMLGKFELLRIGAFLIPFLILFITVISANK